MIAKLSSTAAGLAVAAALLCPAPARAMDPVTAYLLTFAAEYLAGKAIDTVWDSASGKPDVRELDRRLKQLEDNAAMRAEMRDAVRQLRAQVNDRVTRDEFRKMTDRLLSDLVTAKNRIDDLEERVELLEVESQDLKNGTKNAGRADHFAARGRALAREQKPYRAVANYNIAIRLGPAAATYLDRGRVYQAMGAHDVAIIDCTEALRRDPKLAAAHVARSESYLARKDYRRAIADADRAVTLSDGKLGTAARDKAVRAVPSVPGELAGVQDELRQSDAALRVLIEELARTQVAERFEESPRKREELQKARARQEQATDELRARRDDLRRVDEVLLRTLGPDELKAELARREQAREQTMKDLRKTLDEVKRRIELEKQIQDLKKQYDR